MWTKVASVLLACPCVAPWALAADTKPAQPAPGRTVEEIKQKLAEISAAPEDKEGMPAERAAALRKLKAYRYLAGMPYDDLVLDDSYNRYAEAATQICAKLGRLDHRPPNPGMPEDEYKLAAKGAASSNLGVGPKNLVSSVDLWMNDSDAGNIPLLGHRRWCINPYMKKAGFGRTDQYTAMYSFDQSRRNVPDFDFVSYPARGLMPVEYFHAGWAWNVSLNPRKYRTPDDAVKPQIYEADEPMKKVGEPLKLDYEKVNLMPFGIPNCIIFRPEKFTPQPGKRYVVEIDGLKRANGRAAEPIRFGVEFVSVK